MPVKIPLAFKLLSFIWITSSFICIHCFGMEMTLMTSSMEGQELSNDAKRLDLDRGLQNDDGEGIVLCLHRRFQRLMTSTDKQLEC